MKKVNKIKIKDLQPWQKKRLYWSLFLFLLVSLSFLAYSVSTLYSDKQEEKTKWKNYLKMEDGLQEKIDKRSANATKVSIGTYIETMKEINLRNNSFSFDYLIWFNWKGNPDLNMAENFRIYRGTITKQELVKDFHKGNTNYQLVRVSATISRPYSTPRFPLDSHQLRIYVESNYPVKDVVFVKANKATANPYISISGYDFKRAESAIVAHEYLDNHGDPTVKKNKVITSEQITEIEISRSDFGTYFKCFIALLGTTIWVFITLYINTNHRVDPLGMIPAALFGTVSNIMIGANLLPDALELGLLEFVNFWGILTVLSVTFTVINVNRIRNKYEDRDFAHLYGLIMFTVIVTVILAGHILLPVSAYRF